MCLPFRTLSVFVAVVFAHVASALTIPAVTFEELVDQAVSIVRTEVTGVRAEWRTSGDGPYIETVITFKVLETLKGAPTAELQLEQLGGKVGDIALVVPGLPTWTVGDRDFLFVSADRQSVCPLVGLPHGRFWIVDEGGEEFVALANGAALATTADLAHSLCLNSHAPRVFTRSAAAQLTAKRFAAAVREELQRSSSRQAQ